MDMRPNLDPELGLGPDRAPSQEAGHIVEAPTPDHIDAPPSVAVDPDLDNPIRKDAPQPPAPAPAMHILRGAFFRHRSPDSGPSSERDWPSPKPAATLGVRRIPPWDAR